MKYPFILKYSSVTNLSDARYAAGTWADIIGFCFDPGSPDYIEPLKAGEIASWINGPLLCGEFGQQPPEWILEFVKQLSLSVVQLPADYQHRDFTKPEGVKILVDAGNTVDDFMLEMADMFLCRDIDVFENLRAMNDKPVLLETDNLDVDAAEIGGIAFKGGKEDKPGTRNHLHWTEFLEKWELE